MEGGIEFFRTEERRRSQRAKDGESLSIYTSLSLISNKKWKEINKGTLLMMVEWPFCNFFIFTLCGALTSPLQLCE